MSEGARYEAVIMGFLIEMEGEGAGKRSEQLLAETGGGERETCSLHV